MRFRRLMDCYFYPYIPTEAKTPSPDEINKLQWAAEICLRRCKQPLRVCREVPFGAAVLPDSGVVCWPQPWRCGFSLTRSIGCDRGDLRQQGPSDCQRSSAPHEFWHEDMLQPSPAEDRLWELVKESGIQAQ